MMSPVSHVIRPAGPDDLDVLLEINQVNVPEVGSVDREKLAFLVDESVIALVVAVDDAIAGFCVVLGPGSTYDSGNYRWFMDRDPSVLYLDRVAFDPAWQGRGLGSALYRRVFDEMAERFPSAPELTLEVNVDPPNEPSLAFHERLGFAEVGRRTSHGLEVSLMSRPV